MIAKKKLSATTLNNPHSDFSFRLSNNKILVLRKIIIMRTNKGTLLDFWFIDLWEFLLQILKFLSIMAHSTDKIHHHYQAWYILEVNIIFSGCTSCSFQMFWFVQVEIAHVGSILLQTRDCVLQDCSIHIKSNRTW